MIALKNSRSIVFLRFSGTSCRCQYHGNLRLRERGSSHVEDALLHQHNFVRPNNFEGARMSTIQSVFDAIQGFMVALGPNVMLLCVFQGLCHPARKVREVYWRVFNNLYNYSPMPLLWNPQRMRQITYLLSSTSGTLPSALQVSVFLPYLSASMISETFATLACMHFLC